MKATLVIDMPKNCDECQFNYDMGFGCDALDDVLAYGGDRKEMQGETRPSWCPLDSKKNRAIPIEWIIKWECGFLKPNGEHRRVIKEMLHDWEKENALDKQIEKWEIDDDVDWEMIQGEKENE